MLGFFQTAQIRFESSTFAILFLNESQNIIDLKNDENWKLFLDEPQNINDLKNGTISKRA